MDVVRESEFSISGVYTNVRGSLQVMHLLLINLSSLLARTFSTMLYTRNQCFILILTTRLGFYDRETAVRES